MVQGKYKIIMKYIVLGNHGFIGKNIFNVLKKSNYDVLGLSRDSFDITDSNDYKKYDFSNCIIIDCIASIDDIKNNFKVNVDSLSNFINYLNQYAKSFKYIYFSTTSTQIDNQVLENSYVKSKYLAEEFIRQHLTDYKIIRLIFPFGIGENPNRLISRLSKKIKNKEQLKISNVTLNLTPIEFLKDKFLSLINDNQFEINFTDGKVYQLIDIVRLLYIKLNKAENYIIDDKKINLEMFRKIKVKYEDIDHSMFDYCLRD